MTAHGFVEIAVEPEVVWDFLMSPVTGPLLDPAFVRSFPVPGTPEGVGQQWCTMTRAEEGGMEVHVVEVLDIQPPHRLVVKLLTSPVSILRITSLQPTPSGCEYTVRYGAHLPVANIRSASQSRERALNADLARVKAIIESGVSWHGPRAECEG